MITRNIFSILFLIFICFQTNAQENEIVPDLSKINDSNLWTIHNREIIVDDVVHLDAKPGDGVLWLKEAIIANASIELDIKGEDARGRSFVGLAFHGLNDSTYDVVYFRPFNFESAQRKTHSVQYISHPEFTWHKLREEHPEMYENLVIPVPDPNDWFHVRIEVDYPEVKAYVNNADEPSLIVKQLSSRKEGWIGFWVGHNSEGWFKNLKISSK